MYFTNLILITSDDHFILNFSTIVTFYLHVSFINKQLNEKIFIKSIFVDVLSVEKHITC